MPDTGAPWNIPYVEPSDLVRDYPAASEDLADAVAAGLSAAGGLVEVKSAIFTGTQSASLTAGDNVAVTDLSITHEVANAANKLIISAFLGAGANSRGFNEVGLAIHDGSGLIAIGASPGSRTASTSGGRAINTSGNTAVTMPSVTFVHTPGAGSKTYTVRAINSTGETRSVFINRNEVDGDNGYNPRTVSAFVIQEVKV